MHDSISEKLGILETGNHAKHATLLRPRKISLESDNVIRSMVGVFSTQLNRGPRTSTRTWISKAHGLHGTKPKRINPRSRDLLGRLTGAKQIRLFELFRHYALCVYKLMPESLVLVTLKRTVEVIARSLFLISRLREHDIHIEGSGVHNRRSSVIERTTLPTNARQDVLKQAIRTEWASSYNARLGGDLVYPLPHDFDIGIFLNGSSHRARKPLSINSKSPARRNRAFKSYGEKLAAHGKKLMLQKACGTVFTKRLQGIGTNELSKIRPMVCGRRMNGPLLKETDFHSSGSELQGALTASKSATDNIDNDSVRHPTPIS